MTDLDQLPRSDEECSRCEDTHFVKDGCELICPRCGHSPSRSTGVAVMTPWQQHESQIRRRVEEGGRPRLVGGYESAYWGDGEYEYHPADGFIAP